MATPAFIVEGISEQRAIQKICPGKCVVTLGINGVSVSIAAIARRIVAIYRRFSNRYFPVVVLFDREGRSESRSDLLKELSNQIKELGVDPRQFVFGVPDRKIENWMLPFVSNVFGKLENELPVEFREETADIGKIQNLLNARGLRYHKTTIGTDLICGIIPSELRKISLSFEDFYRQIETFCVWNPKI